MKVSPFPQRDYTSTSHYKVSQFITTDFSMLYRVFCKLIWVMAKNRGENNHRPKYQTGASSDFAWSRQGILLHKHSLLLFRVLLFPLSLSPLTIPLSCSPRDVPYTLVTERAKRFSRNRPKARASPLFRFGVTKNTSETFVPLKMLHLYFPFAAEGRMIMTR